MVKFFDFPVPENTATGNPENLVRTFEQKQTETITAAFHAAKIMLMNEREIMSEAILGASDFLIAAELNPDDFALSGFPPYGFSLSEPFHPVSFSLSNGDDTFLTVGICTSGSEDPETGLPVMEISYTLRRDTGTERQMYDFFNFRWVKEG